MRLVELGALRIECRPERNIALNLSATTACASKDCSTSQLVEDCYPHHAPLLRLPVKVGMGMNIKWGGAPPFESTLWRGRACKSRSGDDTNFIDTILNSEATTMPNLVYSYFASCRRNQNARTQVVLRKVPFTGLQVLR